MKIILVQGPPGSGKDTFSQMLHELIPESRVMKFADPIRKMIDGVFPCIDIEKAKSTCPSIAGKDSTLTVRQLMIDFSEEFLKPRLGQEIFGLIALDKALSACADRATACIFSDSGFKAEAEPLFGFFSKKNIFIIHLFREGHSFAGDSRSYWSAIDQASHFPVYNNGTFDDLLSEAKSVARFIGGQA